MTIANLKWSDHVSSDAEASPAPLQSPFFRALHSARYERQAKIRDYEQATGNIAMVAMSNRARVGDAFDLLAQYLKPFVSRHMARTASRGQDWAAVFAAGAKPPSPTTRQTIRSFCCGVMADCWRGTFDRQLPRGTRNLVFTLRDKRNELSRITSICSSSSPITRSIGSGVKTCALQTGCTACVSAPPHGCIAFA